MNLRAVHHEGSVYPYSRNMDRQTDLKTHFHQMYLIINLRELKRKIIGKKINLEK